MSAPTMEKRLDNLAEAVEKQFAGQGIEHELSRAFGELTLVVGVSDWQKAAELLRDHKDFGFDELIDLCGVDYSTYGQGEWDTSEASNTGFGRAVERDKGFEIDGEKRFAVVCHLLSLDRNVRLRLKTYCDGDSPIIASLCPVWSAANWFEREAFDMYGILFEGHPDLRRILTDYGFVGHPLRKDFPLAGHVEMRYDPDKQRVIYEPVDIEPRTLVPRTIRDDRWQSVAAPESEDNDG